MNEFPRPTATSRRRVPALMLGKAPFQFIGRADIESAGRLALKDVHDSHDTKEW